MFNQYIIIQLLFLVQDNLKNNIYHHNIICRENVCIDETEVEEAEKQSEVDLPESNAEEVAVSNADAEIKAEIEREELEEEGQITTSNGRTGKSFFFGQMEIQSCSENEEKYTCTTR